MEVKRTIKTEVESFELGDVITFKLKDGEKVHAKAVQKTDVGSLAKQNEGGVNYGK